MNKLAKSCTICMTEHTSELVRCSCDCHQSKDSIVEEIEELRQSLHDLRAVNSVLTDRLLEDEYFDYFVRNILTYSKGLAELLESKLKELVYKEFMKGTLDDTFTNFSESDNFIRKMV